MGTQQTYKCTNCGYSAEVSGGSDVGMRANSNTVICLDCKTQEDIAFVPEGVPTVDTPLGRDGHLVTFEC